jgi:membrane protein
VALVDRLDAFQQRHPQVGLPIAVVYKFFDDQGNYLAALITYYGFLSLFPLLLLLSTVLNFVLHGDVALQQRVLKSALGQFPMVGAQLKDTRGVRGSGIGLFVGVLGTLYGGLGAAQAAQNAMNTVWRVPRNSRPNPLRGRGRSLVLVSVVGISVAGTTFLSALVSSAAAFGASVDASPRVLLVIATFAVNVVVFTVAFRVATTKNITIRQTLPGATFAAVSWQVLQIFGTAYVGHVVKDATVTNSVFALVLGLIGWIYIEAFVVVLAAEYNAVRAFGLYPRSLMTPFTDDVVLTPADQAAYTSQARAQRSKGFEDITVSFDPPDSPATGVAPATGVVPAADAAPADAHAATASDTPRDKSGRAGVRGRLGGLLAWVFRDRRTGRIVVAQLPNLPLVVWIVARAIRFLVHGGTGTVFAVIADLALAIWAGDEIVRGVNPWRRALGVAVAVVLVLTF